MKCILVESDAAIRRLVRNALAGDGYQVREFEDGDAALKALKDSSDADVVVLAWDLAGPMSGSELLARMIQEKIEVPRLVTSSTVSLTVRNRATALRAMDLLMKPIDVDRLKAAVRQAAEDPRQDSLVLELREVLIGQSATFLDAVVKLAQAIRAMREEKISVLLVAENGCGKEEFAQLLHKKTRGDKGELEAINLAGLSGHLIESELFGHEKGAFTGADSQHTGAFERAGEATLFLDELGCLELRLQPKLLRAIQQREFIRVGGKKALKFRSQLVSATNLNLAEEVQRNRFREDLYHRVSEFEIRIPPLRDRPEDLAPLIQHFNLGSGYVLEPETWTILKSYPFPGNVRELQNILKQARAVCPGRKIRPVDLPGEIMQQRTVPQAGDHFHWPASLFEKKRDDALQQIERRFDREYLQRKLDEAGGNKTRAAQRIGLTTKTLLKKLRECGLGDAADQNDLDEE